MWLLQPVICSWGNHYSETICVSFQSGCRTDSLCIDPSTGLHEKCYPYANNWSWMVSPLVCFPLQGNSWILWPSKFSEQFVCCIRNIVCPGRAWWRRRGVGEERQVRLSHYGPGFTVLSMTERSSQHSLSPLLHLFLCFCFITEFILIFYPTSLRFHCSKRSRVSELCNVALAAEDHIITTFLQK